MAVTLKKTEILVNSGGEENPKATPPAKHGHPSPSTESMGEPPRKIASRERGWVKGMQIDTQNQVGDQVSRVRRVKVEGMKKCPPRNIKVGKDNPPQGPAQCRKTTGGG